MSWGRFSIISMIVLLGSVGARADVAETCFDFSSPIFPPGTYSAHWDLSKGKTGRSGTLGSGVVWAKEERIVRRPVVDIVADLLSHELTRNPETSGMIVEAVRNAKDWALQRVSFDVKPFPFITVSWKEEWSFGIESGTPENPERVWVAYQKVEGTSHIRHLCGVYVLTRRSGAETQLSLYEEVLATRRTREDTQKGIATTLERLSKAE